LACENVTQATANDVLRLALRQIPNVVLHIHDEIVVETDRPDELVTLMTQVMTTSPSWAPDLPLAIDIHVMDRYGKA